MKREMLVVSTEATNKAQDVLHLTPWGKIRIRVFEDEAIMHALDVLKSAKNLKDRFGYFFNAAYRYSRDNRIPLNDKRYNLLKSAYQMPEDAKMVFVEGEINLKGEKVSYKNKSKAIERPYNPEAEKYGELSRRKDEEWEQLKREREQKRQAYWAQQSLLDVPRSSVPEEALPF
jgi:hypothetical protein